MKPFTQVLLFFGIVLVLILGFVFILIALTGPGAPVQGGSGGVGV